MRNTITMALVIGFLTTTSNVEAGRARMQVRVYDAAMMPAADQTVALRAAAGVLAAAGIDVMWLPCAEAPAAVCATPLAPAELSVRIVRLPALPSAHGQLQLGYSLVDTRAGEGRLATVFVDRVQWLAEQTGAETPVLVGFAIAHEIGHLLLGTNAHPANGVMRAIWARQELQHARASDWLFSSTEASRMRSSIAARNGLRSSQHDASGCSAADDDDAGDGPGCRSTASAAALRGMAAATDR